LRWVFDKSFVGLDRREGRFALRLNERRRVDAAGLPPSLPTALLQLKLAAFGTDEAGLLKFSYHASSVAMLASALGRDDVAEPLREMVQLLTVPRDREYREEMVRAFLLEAESNLG
jgi:hypothetical protein